MIVSKQENFVAEKGYSLEKIYNDTLLITFDGSKIITIDDVITIKVIVLEFFDHKPFKNIVNFGKKSGILTNEAKKFIAEDPEFNRYKICDALITKSFTTSLLIGVYLKLFNPKIPTKTFSNLSEAKAWVKSF